MGLHLSQKQIINGLKPNFMSDIDYFMTFEMIDITITLFMKKNSSQKHKINVLDGQSGKFSDNVPR